MFITDRDLLVHEPSLFRDVVWTGQRLCKGVASVTGTTLTASALDNDFAAASIGAGHVAVVDGIACEVISRDDTDQLTVSRIRPTQLEPAIPVGPITDKPLWIVTFAPQIRLVHLQLLRLIGAEETGTGALPGAILESQITNPGDLASLEAFGVLAFLLAAAAATAASSSPLAVRAAFYRGLFSQERSRVTVRLDLDGDGVADAERRLNAAALERA
ncbi:MAG: hypothetical protein AMXMBFR58_28350 [Phycisphaerae bacterium]